MLGNARGSRSLRRLRRHRRQLRRHDAEHGERAGVGPAVNLDAGVDRLLDQALFLELQRERLVLELRDPLGRADTA